MSRIYGYDILTTIKAIANDVTNGMNTMITTINTERSLTGLDACPQLASITEGYPKNFLPEMIIDVDESEVDNDLDVLGIGGSTLVTKDVTQTTEVFTVLISVVQKTANIQLTYWMEIYAEAIYRVFHNYCDSDITWMIATNSIRDEIYFNERETGKISGFSFDVRIN